MNKRNGITLIALIITIIVLLILAGVTIALVVGDNGILSKSQQAKSGSIVAEEKEQVDLAYSSALTKNLGNSVTVENLQTELDNVVGSNKTEVSTNDDGTLNVLFTETGNNYTTKGPAAGETGVATLDYEIEIINDYAVSEDASYKVLVIYTNNTNSAFVYDGINCFDITNSNYTYNGRSYSKIFGIPFNGTDTIDDSLISEVDRNSITVTEVLYDCDVNMTGRIDFNDQACCFGTINITWTLDTEQKRAIILNSDVNKDKHVDEADQSLIFSNVN